jgi:hypothetical protein
MAVPRTGIPSPTQIEDVATRRVVQAIKDRIELYDKIIGSNDDRRVTEKNLIDVGLVKRERGSLVKSPSLSGGVTDKLFLRWLGEEYKQISFITASFIVGVEAANTIPVAIQLKNAEPNNLRGVRSFRGYLSLDPDGNTFDAVTGDLTAGTNGDLVDENPAFHAICEQDGTIDINVRHTPSSGDYYLCLIRVDNRLVISPVISFGP